MLTIFDAMLIHAATTRALRWLLVKEQPVLTLPGIFSFVSVPDRFQW